MEQKAFIGKESILELLPILKKYDPKHIFLVRGKSSYTTCGAEQVINQVVSELNCELTEFLEFSENPKSEDLEKGLSLLRTQRPDVIIGVGGGSAMDMAKLIRFFFSYEGDIIGKVFQKTKKRIPLIAIPTTSGTGAETTSFSVVYKDKVKYSVEHEEMLPDYALVYPPFTYGNPMYLTACTGFDALAQAIEAYWNRNANKESDDYAEKAISLLWRNLPMAINNPTEEVREKVSEGSYWAGRAINITKTTAPHAFSYPFTSYYGYPHGHAVALTFPFFFDYYIKLSDNQRKVSMLKTAIGCSIKEYIHNLGLMFMEDNIDVDFVIRNVNMNRLENYPLKIQVCELKKYIEDAKV